MTQKEKNLQAWKDTFQEILALDEQETISTFCRFHGVIQSKIEFGSLNGADDVIEAMRMALPKD